MSTEDDREDEVSGRGLRRSQRTALASLAVAAAIGITSLALWEQRAPEGVVIGVAGCSDACRANLARRLAFHLEEQGFVVVADALPASSEEARATARREEVAHSLFVSLAPDRRLPGHAGAVSVLATVRAWSQTGDEAPAEAAALELVSEAPTEDHALLRIGLDGVDALAPELIARLLQSALVETYLDEGDVSSSSAVTRHAALKQAHRGAVLRARAEVNFAEACDAIAAEVREDDRVTCVTEGCGEEYIVAVRDDGLIVQSDPGAPVFPLGTVSDVRRVQAPEQVSRVSWEGTREPLSTTANIFGYASASESGALAMVVSGRDAQALVVRNDDGRERVLVEVAAPMRLLAPAIDAAGSSVAFGRVGFAEAEPSLFAIPTTERSTPREATTDTGRGQWVELTLEGVTQRLLVAFVPAVSAEARAILDAQGDTSAAVDADLDELDDEITQRVEAGMPLLAHLALLRVDAQRTEVVARVGGTERSVSFLAGARGDELVVIGHTRESCALGRWRWAPPDDAVEVEVEGTVAAAPSGVLAWTPLEVCPRLPVLAGAYLYGEAWVTSEDDPSDQDPEVVRVALDGTTTILTHDAIPERHVQARVLPDGRTVVAFERLPRRRYARHPAAAACYLFDEPPAVME